MRGSLARRLRKVAKAIATTPDSTTNKNVQVKSMKNGRFVINENGAFVPEEVPVVTYTTEYVEDCPRKIYKELKAGVE